MTNRMVIYRHVASPSPCRPPTFRLPRTAAEESEKQNTCQPCLGLTVSFDALEAGDTAEGLFDFVYGKREIFGRH